MVIRQVEKRVQPVQADMAPVSLVPHRSHEFPVFLSLVLRRSCHAWAHCFCIVALFSTRLREKMLHPRLFVVGGKFQEMQMHQ